MTEWSSEGSSSLCLGNPGKNAGVKPEIECGVQNRGDPKDGHTLISRACEYVTLHGKRDFAEVIKLKILRWGSDLGLSRWVLNPVTVSL